MNNPQLIPSLITTAGRAKKILTEDAICDIASFLSSVNDCQGGFYDRAGQPDLYYTAFGLSCFSALEITVPRVEIERDYLNSYQNLERMSFIDLISLIRCYKCIQLTGSKVPIDNGRRQNILQKLEQYRTADGGFSHERTDIGKCSVYAVFLAWQAYQDSALPPPWPALADIPVSIEGLKTSDGGYSNHPGASRGLTTASAAAAILFTQAGNLDKACETLEYLENMRTPAGGYKAGPTAPGPDLLSTATALYARYVCNRPLPETVLPETITFVESLWDQKGGFCAVPKDPVPDVEYTFYGLLALGSLSKSGSILHGIDFDFESDIVPDSAEQSEISEKS